MFRKSSNPIVCAATQCRVCAESRRPRAKYLHFHAVLFDGSVNVAVFLPQKAKKLLILVVDLDSVVHRLNVTNDCYALLTESNKNFNKTVENDWLRVEMIIQALS